MTARILPIRKTCIECGAANRSRWPLCTSCAERRHVDDNHEPTSLVDVFGEDDFPQSWKVRAT